MTIKNILSVLALGLALTACVDKDWDVPQLDQAPYGNNALEATNVVTLAQLKEMYPNYSKTDTTLMDKDAQLRVYVTGNDVTGNLYNSIAVQDENDDAIIICISAGNLYSYLPVGQELLIDTKGLYIGSYDGQPQIGTPYTNSAGTKTFPSRMANAVWQQHFRLLPTTKTIQTVAENAANPVEGAYVIPEYTISEFRSLSTTANAGRLMTIKDVEVQGADGTNKKWASQADAGTFTNVQLYFQGGGSNLMLYTSIYADFANDIVPAGKLNLSGIWKVYGTKWELVLRDLNDVTTQE